MITRYSYAVLAADRKKTKGKNILPFASISVSVIR